MNKPDYTYTETMNYTLRYICSECGAMVANRELHNDWHEEIGKYQRYVELLQPKSYPTR